MSDENVQRINDAGAKEIERLRKKLSARLQEIERLTPIAKAAIAYVEKWKADGAAGLDQWSDLFNAVESSREPQPDELSVLVGGGGPATTK